MIRWALLTIIATGLFWLLYRLTLGRDRWFQLSRLFIVVSLLFALLFPLIRIPVKTLPPQMRLTLLDEVEVAQTAATVASEAAPSISPWMAIYVVGTMVALALLAWSLLTTVLRLRKFHYVSRDGIRLSLLDDETAPFSFFNFIAIGAKSMSDDELRSVLTHESEHVHQHHTVDVLLARIVCCLLWFNPMAWMLLAELKAVHEYQADAATVANGNRKDYFRLLFRQATGFSYGTITNNFNSINLKKRITMMNKTKSRFGAWKMLAALPLVAALMMVGCKQESTSANTDDNNTPAAEQAAAVDPNVEPQLPNTAPDPSVLDEAPEFPGGNEAFAKFITDNLHYPEEAKTKGIEGRVLVQFTVNTDGSIVNVELARGIGGGCDEEALRVVKSMPKWKPAIKDGKPVAGQFSLPIMFKMK